ncbi:hypothetical protein K0C01_12285 [Salinarchaeum sp. IM2453]|uniref:hypothetical protein n=1 Tax=Salinarchaeum sp. IM2453 TaxID=2862870 RepID=UPI001C8305A3|nr:hypothetical protein [Salinarchaeum sp. IM2453]QZA88540.1 hypothetical protein K0C01_12285 [Salinarchaeum sp. IM2453]
MYRHIQKFAEAHDIPYRGLPDVNTDRQYTGDDIPELIEYLQSDYFLNREIAARQIGYVAQRYHTQATVKDKETIQQLEPAINALEPLLDDVSPSVRKAAGAALDSLRPLFPDKVPEHGH